MFKFIGNGSAFNTALGNNSAYYKKGKTLFMIDCGSANFDRILKMNLLDGVDNVHVLMTHTHPDHIGSLGDLIFYAFYNIAPMFEPKVTVHFPADLEVDKILKLMGVGVKTYNIKNIVEVSGFINADMNISFSPFDVEHVKELNCYGYLIHFAREDQVVYYSGDSNMIPEDILYYLQEETLDYLYQDTCRADYEGNVHLSLRVLAELIPAKSRDKVYCMHLDKQFERSEAVLLGFNVVSSDVE